MTIDRVFYGYMLLIGVLVGVILVAAPQVGDFVIKPYFWVLIAVGLPQLAPRLDEAQIRAQIVGRPLAQARFYLERLPIRSVAIKEQPLSLPLMPLLIGRISLHYIVQSGAPAATTAGAAAPSPSPNASP